jgi:hypothetical protein
MYSLLHPHPRVPLLLLQRNVPHGACFNCMSCFHNQVSNFKDLLWLVFSDYLLMSAAHDFDVETLLYWVGGALSWVGSSSYVQSRVGSSNYVQSQNLAFVPP